MWTRLRRRDRDDGLGRAVPSRRPASGSTPARTVAICGRVVQWIAATSWPPNAGFHATSVVAIGVELDRVAGEAGAERGRGAGRDLAAPRGARREDRPRVAVAAPSRSTAAAVSSSLATRDAA